MWRLIVEPFREFGTLAGSLHVIDRVLRRISPRLRLYVYEMMVQPISDQPLLPPNLVKNLDFAEIGRDHPDLLLMPVRDDVKALRFEQGALCLGAYCKGKLVGYLWLCSGRYDDDEVRCTYHLAEVDCSVFDFDLYVFPEHRSGIGFMAVWHGANLFLAERGIHYAFSRLTHFNLTSRRAHAHLGGRCVGRALFLQAWSVELMLSTLFPFFALTWRRRQRVRLRLTPAALKHAPAATRSLETGAGLPPGPSTTHSKAEL